MTDRVSIKSAVPTFLVDDVAATARWYAATLGVYASLQRGGAELMLLGLAGYRKPDLSALRPAGVWDAYLRLDGVEALYEQLRDQPCVRMPLRQQPYGDREFEVRDSNGYILVFGG